MAAHIVLVRGPRRYHNGYVCYGPHDQNGGLIDACFMLDFIMTRSLLIGKLELLAGYLVVDVFMASLILGQLLRLSARRLDYFGLSHRGLYALRV